MTKIRLLLLPLLLLSFTIHAQPDLVVSHYQKQQRYDFGLQVLDLALSKLNIQYQIETPSGPQINEARGEVLITNGKLDVQWMSTSKQREKKMLVVRIPIYQGLLGLRLLLTTVEKNKHIGQIRNLTQLQQYVGGHGTHWQDLPVYQANKLPVSTYINYQTLFIQLANNRFDYFHRGLNEIWDEQKKHSDTLKIANNVMLFYPHPVYFFVGKHNPDLAQYIQQGLHLALKDGSFKKLFLKEQGEFIEKAQLNKRHLIRLINPVVPQDSPKLNTQWWLPQKFQLSVKS